MGSRMFQNENSHGHVMGQSEFTFAFLSTTPSRDLFMSGFNIAKSMTKRTDSPGRVSGLLEGRNPSAPCPHIFRESPFPKLSIDSNAGTIMVFSGFF